LAEAFVPLLALTSIAWFGDPPRPTWGFDPEWVDPKDLDEAITEYREAIRLDPTLAYVRRNLGNLLILKGDIEGALKEYHEAARLDPSDPDVHEESAFRLYLRGRIDLAIHELQEAIPLDPKNDIPRVILGSLYREQGKTNQAFALYRDALKVSGDFNGRRRDLQATGKPDEVLAAFREAISEAARSRPGNPWTLNNLASALAISSEAEFRDGKLAVELATRACELTAWKNPAYLDALAAAHAEAGDFDAAVRRQTEAISLQTDAHEKEAYGMRLRLYQEKKPFRAPK
jgi:tetratricopeptide (TPR) repeat protein